MSNTKQLIEELNGNKLKTFKLGNNVLSALEVKTVASSLYNDVMSLSGEVSCIPASKLSGDEDKYLLSSNSCINPKYIKGKIQYDMFNDQSMVKNASVLKLFDLTMNAIKLTSDLTCEFPISNDNGKARDFCLLVLKDMSKPSETHKLTINKTNYISCFYDAELDNPITTGIEGYQYGTILSFTEMGPGKFLVSKKILTPC